ncbi:MAG: hypothetical protein NTV88_04270 [Candidatus Micrarchaeota archaeon]|nr:hypothetical protein [Candidatus Micrarchaeota archaeon]
MRLYTHTDLDGIFSAVLISVVEEVDEIRFVDPGTVQAGKIFFNEYDIISDLPFDRRAGMWFDHHESSRPSPDRKFEGAWGLKPSAARVIFEWAENPYLEKYSAALLEVDKIDSGQVPIEEARNPTGWFLLSNTLESNAEKSEDDKYRRHVIALIKKNPDISAVLKDGWVEERVESVQGDLEKFKQLLLANTKMIGKVAFSDMRSVSEFPRGNNYLIYSLFPSAVTSVRIMPLDEEKDSVKLSVGHNIYGKKSTYDVGAAMKKLGGGGHKPVGGASVSKEQTDEIVQRIIQEINDWEGAGK